MEMAIKEIMKTVKFLEVAKTLLDDQTDFTSNDIRNDFLKLSAVCYYDICQEYDTLDYDYSKSPFGFGFEKQYKEPFFSKYDEAVYEVRKIDPEFQKGRFLNRTEPNWYIFERAMAGDKSEEFKGGYEDRRLQNIRFQEEAFERIHLRDIENQKKKYWMEHPDEYKIYLAVENRKMEELEDRKTKLRNDIKIKTRQFDEMKDKNNLEING